jgi:hypothetical protein
MEIQMKSETIILTSVQVSVPVSWGEPSEAVRSRPSEDQRIFDFFRGITDFDSEHMIRIGEREYQIEPAATGGNSGGSRWAEQQHGGCVGKISLAPVNGGGSVNLQFKLTKDSSGQGGQLTLTCDPAAMLVGCDACPTFPRSGSKEVPAFPSSSWWVNDRMFALGFRLLAELYERLGEEEGDLFDAETLTAIGQGRSHIEQLSWQTTLPTPDPASFLKLLPAMYGHTIGEGDSFIQLAGYLGLKLHFHGEAKGKRLRDVTLSKRHGTKLLYTIRFSPHHDDQTSGDVEGGLVGAESSSSGVRVNITAHRAGLADIVSQGQRWLKALRKVHPEFPSYSDPDQLHSESATTARQISDVLFILSHPLDDNDIAQESLASWLVDEILYRVLRLNLLTHYRQEDLQALMLLDDDIAEAWRNAEPSGRQNWADAIAKKLKMTSRTVRNRRDAFQIEYKIDIEFPCPFYHDVPLFGSASQTSVKDRMALTASMSRGEKKIAQQVREEAWQDFEEQRLAMASTVDGPLMKIPLETVAPDITFEKTPRRPAKRLAAPTKQLTRLVSAAASKADGSPPARPQANKRAVNRTPSKVAAKSTARDVKRRRGRKKQVQNLGNVVSRKRRVDGV